MEKGLNKEKLDHLAGLARIRIPERQEEKLRKDAENILAYFDELNQVNTDNIMPMTGGTDLRNTAREDIRSGELVHDGVESFPKARDGYLEVPAIIKETSTDL